jgi:hypothetical protein
MSLADTPTLAQVLTLAQRLPAADKLRLIARLAPDLAAALPALPAEDAGDSWGELLRLSDESAALPPLATDSADLLSAMRR